MTERTTVAFVRQTNGAYLIQFVGDLAQDRPEDDNFDAASSLVVAKRVAVAGARSAGYHGAVRWTHAGYGWELEMRDVEDEPTIQY